MSRIDPIQEPQEARINVRVKGPMATYLENVTGPQGLYENQSEYIRDLIRHDMEQRDQMMMVDDEAVESIMRGVEDWKAGRYTEINAPAELNTFMGDVMNEARARAAKK